MTRLKQHGLTVVFLAVFAVSLAAQVAAGCAELNRERGEHGHPPLDIADYLTTGHMWEATFENWESEFLQMAAFVVFTVFLYQKGSPESRRIGAVEPSDVDPRHFSHRADAPWPVRRGGWILWLYERSLGTVFAVLFLFCWCGHALGGWRTVRAEEMMRGRELSNLSEYLASARFWFESFQNWQSEFLSIAAMVGLSVFLRQRGSPESKPVHAPHAETGR